VIGLVSGAWQAAAFRINKTAFAEQVNHDTGMVAQLTKAKTFEVS